MWKTSLPKSELYFKRTFPSQWMTKLGGILSPSSLSPSSSLSSSLSLSLALPPSLFNKLVSQRKTNDRALPGLCTLHFHLLQHECKLSKEYPCRQMSVPILYSLLDPQISWSKVNMMLFSGVGERRLSCQSVFLHRQPYYRTHHKLMLYLSNLLFHQSRLYPIPFSVLRCIRGWITLRDSKGRTGHWLVKHDLCITVVLIKPRYLR